MSEVNRRPRFPRCALEVRLRGAQGPFGEQVEQRRLGQILGGTSRQALKGGPIRIGASEAPVVVGLRNDLPSLLPIDIGLYPSRDLSGQKLVEIYAADGAKFAVR